MNKSRALWTSVSLPGEQEGKFRQRYLREDIKQAVIGMAILMIPLVAFVYNDFLLFHNSPVFFGLVTLRGLLLIMTVCLIIWLKHVKSYRRYDRLMFLWALFGAAAIITINFTRIHDFTMHVLVDIVIILIFYLVIANNLTNQLIIASLFTIGEAVMIILGELPLTQPALFTIIISFLLANAAGFTGSWRLQTFRRREFVAREKEEHAKQKMELLATIDGLTGIYNSRTFMHIAKSELTRFRRYGRTFTFLMLDIDHFKMINDTYGHLTGDSVLKKLVDVITAQLRHIDIMGRLGGEEFGIILPETEGTEAILVAERILEVVREMRVDAGRQEPVKITISIGLARVHQNDATPDSFIARADAAMYQAKRNGRDRLEMAGKATA